MRDYDFHTLNDSDLELLVRDLLNKQERELGSRIVFNSFPAGKDKGIDLLYSSSNNIYEIVVQVKHYSKTPYRTLLSDLIKSTKARTCEKDKLVKLSPQRYILVTSQTLTLENKKEILKEMEPYIISRDDIIDQVELNRLLGQYKEIEEDNYKLWFSSRIVFERIIHNDVHGRSQQLEKDISKKFQLYVQTDHLKNAESILEAQNFVLIIGEPGTGKSTIAEMILYRLAGLDYQMYWMRNQLMKLTDCLKRMTPNKFFILTTF